MKKNDLLDQYFDKRRSFIYRLFFSILGILLIFLITLKFQGNSNFIAKISVEGIIYDKKDLIDQIKVLENDVNVKGLITIVNSPGGTFVGSKELYDSIKNISKNIPTVVYMREMATSGGYLVSLSSDRIYANVGTLTGSIGVILQTADLSKLLEKLGISPIIVRSGELKSVPNPAEQINEDKLTYLKEITLAIQDEFLDIVKSNRDISDSVIDLVSDGRILTGRQAKNLKLIDDIGSEKDALAWLKKKSGVDENVKVIDFSEEKDLSKLLDLTFLKKKINYLNQNFYNGFFAIWMPGI
ncbi:MAG: signal peptide peptidase SppA [Pseudomonadota bacterium]|nr:signal peptide peptidase SppA [Pseudomonadota bacterium]